MTEILRIHGDLPFFSGAELRLRNSIDNLKLRPQILVEFGHWGILMGYTTGIEQEAPEIANLVAARLSLKSEFIPMAPQRIQKDVGKYILDSRELIESFGFELIHERTSHGFVQFWVVELFPETASPRKGKA